MRKYRWILTGCISFLLVAAGAYFWVNGLMNSLYAYRSLLSDNPPAPAEPFSWADENPMTRRVVFILVDALRDDTSHNSDVMPYLNELRAQGAWATSHSRPPSYSAPGYSVLNIGAWPALSDGPALNLEYDEIPAWTQDNLFSASHRAGLKTAISAYNWFEKLIPQADVDASFYTVGEDDAADRAVVDAAIPWLASDDYQLIFVHLDQVDYAGHHEGGPQDPRWDAAATRVDNYIREIVSLVDLGQDTVFITSDHGQIDAGGHGGQDAIVLIEPFVLVGAGVQSGEYPDTQMVDIAPTLAVLLGANIPATSQGHVLTDMLTLSLEQESIVGEALRVQQIQLHETYVAAIGAVDEDILPIREDMEIVDATQFAMDAMLLTQVDNERQPRFTWFLIFAFIPAYGLFKYWNKTMAWLLGGAAAYLALFNFRYAILDGRTYSLSSVISVDDLIQFNAMTAAIALGVVWLFVMLKLGIFKKGALKAAESSILLTALTLYLLALPILWSYAINGAVVTWVLPDFASMFVGFLSLIQSLMVALIGLVLTGMAALVAWISS